MYKLLLILKYLGRRLAPLLAAMAVMLCAAMVIIVISVMGGFLQMMRDAAQRLTGQVTVSSQMWGFPHYDELVGQLGSLPQVEAATAVVRTYGLVNLHDHVLTVQVVGIDPAGLDQVTGYRDTIYWTSQRVLEDLNRDLPPPQQQTPRQKAFYESYRQRYEKFELQDLAMSFTLPGPQPDTVALPGMVLGIEVNPFHQRDGNGQYDLGTSSMNSPLTLTALPLTRRGTVMEPSVRRMIAVNEFKSGLYEIDANRVYVPFALLQAMLKMDATEQADPETGLPTGAMEPARTSEIMIRGAVGVGLEQLAATISRTVEDFQKAHPDLPPLWVMTWEQQHSTLLNAVEGEKFLITFLFAFISLVAVVMIATTFYMIVLEKTRDIGVLRAIGAPRWGIANIFLGYGLMIGTIGVVLGVALAVTIVFNLNTIQDTIEAWSGWRMWNPETYYFDRIPEHVDWLEASMIAAGGVVSSVVGAIIPAYLAARLDPVESLRYE